MNASEPVALSMRAIAKRFAGVTALDGVDLQVRRAEVHALVGENGAGKSTLMKVLSGAHPADGGTMSLQGKPYAPKSPLRAREAGVAMIYQELTLAPHLTVAENIVLGREPQKWSCLDSRAIERRARDALKWLEHPGLTPQRRVLALSPGERQLVEVARALAFDAAIVVMDEPTSSLSRREAERLFEVVSRLHERDVSVIYISHFLEEVRRVAQRYTVLRDGRSVATGEVPKDEASYAAFSAQLLQAMAGRSIEEAYPRVERAPQKPCLEVAELSGASLPARVSFTLRRGEILGIFGLVGAGRSELLRALFGLDAVREGEIRVGPSRDHGAPAHARLSQGVGLLSEDRKGEGLAQGLSITDNVILSRPISTLSVLRPRAQRERAQALSVRLALKHRSVDQRVSELSGGNQQKVALMRLLHHDVDVLLLDEPTRGIDVGSKAEIYKLIGELARDGKAVLLVSSYLPELLGVCDRIAVMSRGRLGAARSVADCSEHGLLEEATRG